MRYPIQCRGTARSRDVLDRHRYLGCLVLGVVCSLGLLTNLVSLAPASAHESQGDSRHSLMNNMGGGPVASQPSSIIPAAEQKPALGKPSDRKKSEKKPRKLIRKPADPSPKPVPNQETAGGSQDQATTSSKPTPTQMKDSAATVAQPSVPSSVGASLSRVGAVTTVTPGTAAMKATAGAQMLPGSSAIAAPGSGGSSSAGSRSAQNLMQQMPGLQQLATGIPLRPQETIAPPAPPLASPSPGVPAAPSNWFAYHVLNRLTYGGTPNELNTVSHMNATEAQDWAMRFMKDQLELDPARPWPTNLHSTAPLPAAVRLDDGYVDFVLSQDKGDWRVDETEPTVLVPDLGQLQDHDLIRKIQSRRQLLEKMVYFWDNHFNTDYRSHFRGQYELFENEAFRTRAFGRFVDLLLASGKSSAMMVYLNTDVNVKENPNENYAREALELHTLGVDDQGRPAGYTQGDIVDAAKAFTGWDTPNGATPGFRFVSSRHSTGSKTVLGQTISFDGSGPGEGEQVLRIAANHPSTARHLAKKLCEYFVSETPSAALITEVASVFTDSGGDIKKVLIAIFTSSDFNNVAAYRGLVKTPLEFVVGIYRNLGVWSSRDPFRTRLTRIGQGLYEMPPADRI